RLYSTYHHNQTIVPTCNRKTGLPGITFFPWRKEQFFGAQSSRFLIQFKWDLPYLIPNGQFTDTWIIAFEQPSTRRRYSNVYGSICRMANHLRVPPHKPPPRLPCIKLQPFDC